jgi:ribosomal protein S18 acetylase RimI-like enzyme
MGRVARLIEIGFAEELDAASRRMVRDMKALGRAGWLGWLIGRLILPPAAYPQGYVWLQDDQLIGNASLLPVSPGSDRWVLANVAVHPDFRRQGIARRMVLACLDLARQQQAAEVVLQVRHDNQGAVDLYRGLGFEPLTTRTEWRRGASSAAKGKHGENLRRARGDEWKVLWQLAGELFPEGVQWPYPLKRGWFEPGSLMGLLTASRARSWVYLEQPERIVAGLLARLNPDGQGWRLIALAPERLRGSADVALVQRALAELARSNLPYSLSYPPGHVDPELRKLGFEAGRTLTWMGLPLEGQGTMRAVGEELKR